MAMDKARADRQLVAMARFGLGARADEWAAISGTPRDWLKKQIREPDFPTALKGLSTTASINQGVNEYAADRKQKLEARRNHEQVEEKGKLIKPFNFVQPVYKEHLQARINAAITTRTSFFERLVHFWSNHFAVSADKHYVGAFVGPMEQQAIRPHVAGHFVDMLQAVIHHPAMLEFLDNQASIGPHSDVAQQRREGGKADRAGLNENLAREILELHTLGVRSVYSQEDVTHFAAILTGWGPAGAHARADHDGFEFAHKRHEPGPKTLLGVEYKQDGVAQAETVLNDLANHPSTARFVSTKLARHFAGDTPAPALVDRLTATYMKSKGYLPDLYDVLIDAEEVWDLPYTRFKTPEEWWYSGWRAMGSVPEVELSLQALTDLGQRPWTPRSPAGFPDRDADWASADGLHKRLEWAQIMAGHTSLSAAELLKAALNENTSTPTREQVARSADSEQGRLLVLMSPEFLRR